MRIIFLFSILGLISHSINSQKLTGVVFDSNNNEPVSNVHVFIEGSSLHDVTNVEGRFEIPINEVVSLPLVISHILYNTVIISNPFTSLPDTIFMSVKEYLLDEVVVQSSRYSRRQLLRAFRREFLGNSLGAASCIIENEDKIDLWFDSKTHILTAGCDEPILIHNRYLGYKIYLMLENFEVEYSGRQLGVGMPIGVFLKGSTFFEDLTPLNGTIEHRREKVFEGSPTHFLRALANERLAQLKYFTYPIKGEFVLEHSPYVDLIISSSLDQKKVRISQRLKPDEMIFSTYHGRFFYGEVGVTRINSEHSRIIFFTDTFMIDSWGNLNNPKDILFMGFMGKFRIGDQLPTDYGIIR